MLTTYPIREGDGDKIQGGLRFGSFDIFKMDVLHKVSMYVCYPHVSAIVSLLRLLPPLHFYKLMSSVGEEESGELAYAVLS